MKLFCYLQKKNIHNRNCQAIIDEYILGKNILKEILKMLEYSNVPEVSRKAVYFKSQMVSDDVWCLSPLCKSVMRSSEAAGDVHLSL